MESSRRFTLILIPLLAVSLILFRACKSEKSLSESETTALQHQADSLQQAVTSAWASLLQADDQVHYNLNGVVQILDEKSSVPAADKDSLSALVENLGPLRRSMEGMKSTAIDAYDDGLFTTINFAIKLANEHAPEETAGLVAGLGSFTGTQLLNYRVSYDGPARAYNIWYEEHADAISGLANPPTPKSYPLFTISE